MRREFYMTYAGRTYPNEIAPWIEAHNVPIMTNAQLRWSEAKEAFLDMFEYDTTRAVDSSGYNSQGDYVDRWGNLTVEESVVEQELQSEEPFFPWTVEEYHTWLSQNRDTFDWAACMDYACEERFDPLWSVEERIEKTIDNTIRHFEMNPPYTLVPVLQGRTVEDYVYSYERLRDAEVDVQLDFVGLGTVCRLSSEKKIVELESKIRERLPSDIRIHGFGVKVNAFKLGATFHTADSQAWVYNPSNGRVSLLERTDGGLKMNVVEMPDTPRTRSLESFKTYYAYVSELMGVDTGIDIDAEIIEPQKALRS